MNTKKLVTLSLLATTLFGCTGRPAEPTAVEKELAVAIEETIRVANATVYAQCPEIDTTPASAEHITEISGEQATLKETKPNHTYISLDDDIIVDSNLAKGAIVATLHGNINIKGKIDECAVAASLHGDIKAGSLGYTAAAGTRETLFIKTPFNRKGFKYSGDRKIIYTDGSSNQNEDVAKARSDAALARLDFYTRTTFQ